MDPFVDARLPAPLRFLGWSVSLGRFFGVEVRLYATSALVFVLAFLQFSAYAPVGHVEALALAAITWVTLYLVVWTHEMGHVLAARRWNVRTERISLSMFGGVAHLSYPAPSPKAEVGISLAGPAVHGVWLAALWALRSVAPSPFAQGGGWAFDPVGAAYEALWRLNVALALFNLLPFFPLDGGHVLRALLAMRWHPNRASRFAAQVGIAGAIGIAAWGLVGGGWGSGLVLMIAISMALKCREEIVAARHSEGPYGESREPWESDPDAWRSGHSAFEEEIDDHPKARRGPRLLPRLSRRGAPAAAPAAGAARTAEDDAELDRLLARVSEVGLSGLSDAERATLQRLSYGARANPDS